MYVVYENERYAQAYYSSDVTDEYKRQNMIMLNL